MTAHQGHNKQESWIIKLTVFYNNLQLHALGMPNGQYTEMLLETNPDCIIKVAILYYKSNYMH